MIRVNESSGCIHVVLIYYSMLVIYVVWTTLKRRLRIRTSVIISRLHIHLQFLHSSPLHFHQQIIHHLHEPVNISEIQTLSHTPSVHSNKFVKKLENPSNIKQKLSTIRPKYGYNCCPVMDMNAGWAWTDHLCKQRMPKSQKINSK